MEEALVMLGTWVGGGILVAITAIQTVRVGVEKKRAEAAHKAASDASVKAENVSIISADGLAKSNADLAAAYKKQAEEWKALSEKAYQEQADYRNWVHDKAKEDNAVLLRLTSENADLKARTDLTPILEVMKRYEANAEKVAETLLGLTEAVKSLMKKAESHK